jgi:hypothetical protein
MATEVRWFRDRAALRFIALGYLPWLAGLNLAWEIAHVRLYTLWQEAQAAYIAFSIAHCTLGDVLIGGVALLLALILGREGALAYWRWGRVAALAMILGAGYTVFSEWMNLTILRSWSYSEAMPRLNLGGFDMGLAPLAQWLVVPPLALLLARKARRVARPDASSIRRSAAGGER